MVDKSNPQEIGRFLLYPTEDGRSRVEVRIEEGSAWLSQSAMAELFQTTKQNISKHLRSIFNEEELLESRVVNHWLTTAEDGKKYQTQFYNLETIIAVGYRVRSPRGTQFRQWATERLQEYVVKGFVMDDERLKEGRSLGVDYFDELLERIRDIRSSEKRFYQKLRDLFTLAIDYDKTSETTRQLFQIVQNKLHFAVSHKTAAELIAERADARQPNMGLTSWKGSRVRKDDVTIAKNYLSEEEMVGLNRIVTMYLDYAEDQAQRGRVVYMSDWRAKLDAFLQFNERDILTNAGTVSMEVAKALAMDEYATFNHHRMTEEAEREALEDDAELERYLKELEGPKPT